MTITAIINSIPYTRILEYEINRSVEDVTGTFAIVVATPYAYSPPFQNGDPITILINKTAVLTGFLETRSITYDDGSHIIKITGRDKVADLVDSTVGNKIEFKAPITLNQIINRVMANIKMTGVKISNRAGVIDSFAQNELVSGSIDETILDFLEKYTRQRQVLMTSDGKGNLVLARAGKVRAQTTLYHEVAEDDDAIFNTRNNILSAQMDFDDSKRFYEYRIHSQFNPSAGKPKAAGIDKDIFPTGGESVVDFLDRKQNSKRRVASKKANIDRIGIAHDPEVRHTRVLDITAESATDIDVLKRRAIWEASVRKARSVTYSCSVQGHTMTENGKPWEPNLLVSIVEAYALIESDMLIKSVKYSLQLGSGSVTELELVHPDSYLPEPVIRKRCKIGHKKKKKGRKGKDDGFYTEIEKRFDHIQNPVGDPGIKH